MTNCDLCGGIGSSPFLTKGDLAYVRCTACGFVQADMSPEEFERRNETEFSASLEEFAAKANDPRRRRRYRKRIEVRIFDAVPQPQESRQGRLLRDRTEANRPLKARANPAQTKKTT